MPVQPIDAAELEYLCAREIELLGEIAKVIRRKMEILQNTRTRVQVLTPEPGLGKGPSGPFICNKGIYKE